MSSQARRDRDTVNEIFGEPLPSITKDEYDDASREDADDRERWLRDNVPPHHG